MRIGIMKMGILGFAVALALVFSPQLGEAARKHPAERYVQPMQVADMLVGGKERVFLLDVRFDWEYADFHIPGANNIAVQVLNKPEHLAQIPKGRKVILYCRTGVRSERALGILLAKGYDAYSMEGGVAAWWRQIVEPPSITTTPFGKGAADFRKRQGLRNYFMNIPGAGTAFSTPPGPALKKPVRSVATPKTAAPKPKPQAAPPQPCAVGRPPNMGNPCG